MAGCEAVVDKFKFTADEVIPIPCGRETFARWTRDSDGRTVEVCDWHSDLMARHAPDWSGEAIPEAERSSAYVPVKGGGREPSPEDEGG